MEEKSSKRIFEFMDGFLDFKHTKCMKEAILVENTHLHVYLIPFFAKNSLISPFQDTQEILWSIVFDCDKRANNLHTH